MPTVATYINNFMNIIVNNSKVSHNVTHVVLSTVISYHKCDIVLAQEIEKQNITGDIYIP